MHAYAAWRRHSAAHAAELRAQARRGFVARAGIPAAPLRFPAAPAALPFAACTAPPAGVSSKQALGTYPPSTQAAACCTAGPGGPPRCASQARILGTWQLDLAWTRLLGLAPCGWIPGLERAWARGSLLSCLGRGMAQTRRCTATSCSAGMRAERHSAAQPSTPHAPGRGDPCSPAWPWARPTRGAARRLLPASHKHSPAPSASCSGPAGARDCGQHISLRRRSRWVSCKRARDGTQDNSWCLLCARPLGSPCAGRHSRSALEHESQGINPAGLGAGRTHNLGHHADLCKHTGVCTWRCLHATATGWPCHPPVHLPGQRQLAAWQRAHLGGKAQRAQRLLVGGWLWADVAHHERLAAAPQAWLRPGQASAAWSVLCWATCPQPAAAAGAAGTLRPAPSGCAVRAGGSGVLTCTRLQGGRRARQLSSVSCVAQHATARHSTPQHATACHSGAWAGVPEAGG